MELRLKMRARATKDLDMVYRGTFEHWLDSLDEALEEDIDDFSYARDEPVRIRGTNTFRVNVAIDFKGKRWGKVQLEVAPVEVEDVLDIDRVEPFDIGQFGLESRRPDQRRRAAVSHRPEAPCLHRGLRRRRERAGA